MKLDYATILALPALATAHGAVTSYVIGGKTYPGYDGFSPSTTPSTIQWQWKTYDPVMQVSSPLMRCNGGTSAKLSAPVAPGDTVTAVYKQWTYQQGPVMVWLFKCAGEFAACTGAGAGWFKIDQAGLLSSPLTGNNWATGTVYTKKQWSSKIPKSLAPGNYLIRHELLALHQSNTPQFYPECAQIVVSGSGTKLPPAEFMKSIPGYAAQSDPGVTVDIYMSKSTTYTIPGGPMYAGW